MHCLDLIRYEKIIHCRFQVVKRAPQCFSCDSSIHFAAIEFAETWPVVNGGAVHFSSAKSNLGSVISARGLSFHPALKYIFKQMFKSVYCGMASQGMDIILPHLERRQIQLLNLKTAFICFQNFLFLAIFLSVVTPSNHSLIFNFSAKTQLVTDEIALSLDDAHSLLFCGGALWRATPKQEKKPSKWQTSKTIV